MTCVYKFFLPALLAFLVSCSTDKESPDYIDNSTFTVISMEKAEKKFEFQDFIDSIDLIELESPEGNVLAGCDKVIAFQESYYILDIKQSNISKFSSTGKFIKQLTTLGKGPGEVTEVNDFILDTKKKEMIIFDKGSGIIFTDLEGKFLRKSFFSPFPDRFEQINAEEFIFYNDYNYFKENEYYNFSLVTKKGELVKSFFSYPGGQECLSTEFGGILSSSSDGILCSNGLGCIIYRIRMPFSGKPKGLSITKEYVFDLGKRGVPINEKEVCKYFSENYINFGVSYMFRNFYETPKKSLTFVVIDGNKVLKCFFVKGKLYVADKSKKDIYNFLFDLPIGINKNIIFAQVPYEDLYRIKNDQHLFNQIKEISPSLRDKLLSMNGENKGRQVIACYRLKE